MKNLKEHARKIAKSIYTSFLPVYVCPCGAKCRGKQQASEHLATHPASIGMIDTETGAIVW